MKFYLAILALAATTMAAPQKRSIDPSLIPDPGIRKGTPNPKSDGADCLGANNIAIPCNCPPNQQELLSKVELFNSQGNAQGTPFNFPTDVNDQSAATRKTRINMLIIALQNFDNTSPGVGCPAAAAAPNYVQMQKQL